MYWRIFHNFCEGGGRGVWGYGLAGVGACAHEGTGVGSSTCDCNV